jgi:hypothetical protein
MPLATTLVGFANRDAAPHVSCDLWPHRHMQMLAQFVVGVALAAQTR